MNNKKIVQFVVAIVLFGAMNAQKKVEKGSSPDRPWVEELPPCLVETDRDNDTVVRYNENYRKKNLFFGKWDITARHPLFYRTHELKEKEEIKFIPMLLGATWNEYEIGAHANNISFTGIDPEKKKFSGRFLFSDSVAFHYTNEGLFKTVGFESHIFYKRTEGHIILSSGDSAFFNIYLDYENPMNTMNRQSSVHFFKKTISIEPIFNSDTAKWQIDRGLYTGFCLKEDNDTLAAISISKDFWGNRAYKFWIGDKPDANTKQVLATVLFMILAYY